MQNKETKHMCVSFNPIHRKGNAGDGGGRQKYPSNQFFPPNFYKRRS